MGAGRVGLGPCLFVYTSTCAEASCCTASNTCRMGSSRASAQRWSSVTSPASRNTSSTVCRGHLLAPWVPWAHTLQAPPAAAPGTGARTPNARSLFLALLSPSCFTCLWRCVDASKSACVLNARHPCCWVLSTVQLPAERVQAALEGSRLPATQAHLPCGEQARPTHAAAAPRGLLCGLRVRHRGQLVRRRRQGHHVCIIGKGHLGGALQWPRDDAS
jgi:hypothetical protein